MYAIKSCTDDWKIWLENWSWGTSFSSTFNKRYPFKRYAFFLYEMNWIQNISETLFPELLQQNGYDTHYYGKWHLGYCNEAFLPINRGFDTFHGFVGAGGKVFES